MSTTPAEVSQEVVPSTAGSEVHGTVTSGGEEINVIFTDGTDQISGLDSELRQVAFQMQEWARNVRDSGVESMIERRHWKGSENPYEHMAQAHWANNSNDIVGAVAELVEGLAYQGVKWELGSDLDLTDCFNQMAAEQNLDDVIRKVGREEFLCSQVIVGMWWDKGTFKVRGKTAKGNTRKTVKEIWYPTRITVLDPTKVVPVGLLAFGQERLAWRATPQEWLAYQMFLSGQLQDEIMARFYVAPYVPTVLEQIELTKIGVNISQLILLNPDLVRRHTLTRSDYERFAPVRMRRIFRLLDMRQQLMEADRASLIGQANYLMLVKKGDDKLPALPSEISNLRAGFRTIAKVPIIFSDHRLSVEIITPKQDWVLTRDRYDLLDKRIASSLINSITETSSSRSGSAEAISTIGKPVAKALEGRRHMLRRFFEQILSREVVNHPLNAGLNIDRAPSMVYTPSMISITDDSVLAQTFVNIRAQRDMSRESLLEFVGLDEEAEAGRMQTEADIYDDIFKTQIPFSAAPGADPAAPAAPDEPPRPPAGAPPQSQGPAGGQGGRPVGGGKPSANATKVNTSPSGQRTPRST